MIPLRSQIVATLKTWEPDRIAAECGGLTISKRLPEIRVIRLDVPEGANPWEALSRFYDDRGELHPDVERVGFERLLPRLGNYRATPIPGTRSPAPYGWHNARMAVDFGSRFTTGHPDVVFVAIDSGVLAAHAAQLPALAFQYSTISNTANATSTSGDSHGSYVLAVATSPRTAAWPGGVPDCSAAAIDCFPTSAGTTDTDSAEAILKVREWALANPGKRFVGNMSFGGAGTYSAQASAISQALAAGVILLGAAGNSNVVGTYVYPSMTAGVVTVGAIGANDEQADWGSPTLKSNHGPGIDITAPGDYVGALDHYFTGTSCAAPLAGMVTCSILSIDRVQHGAFTLSSVDVVGDATAETPAARRGLLQNSAAPSAAPGYAAKFPNAGIASKGRAALATLSSFDSTPRAFVGFAGFSGAMETLPGAWAWDEIAALRVEGAVHADLACFGATATWMELSVPGTVFYDGAPGMVAIDLTNVPDGAGPWRVRAWNGSTLLADDTYDDLAVRAAVTVTPPDRLVYDTAAFTGAKRVGHTLTVTALPGGATADIADGGATFTATLRNLPLAPATVAPVFSDGVGVSACSVERPPLVAWDSARNGADLYLRGTPQKAGSVVVVASTSGSIGPVIVTPETYDADEETWSPAAWTCLVSSISAPGTVTVRGDGWKATAAFAGPAAGVELLVFNAVRVLTAGQSGQKVQGYKKPGTTVTVQGATATFGPVTTSADDEWWEAPVLAAAPGANSVTVADSTGDSLTVTVQGPRLQQASATVAAGVATVSIACDPGAVITVHAGVSLVGGAQTQAGKVRVSAGVIEPNDIVLVGANLWTDNPDTPYDVDLSNLVGAPGPMVGGGWGNYGQVPTPLAVLRWARASQLPGLVNGAHCESGLSIWRGLDPTNPIELLSAGTWWHNELGADPGKVPWQTLTTPRAGATVVGFRGYGNDQTDSITTECVLGTSIPGWSLAQYAQDSQGGTTNADATWFKRVAAAGTVIGGEASTSYIDIGGESHSTETSVLAVLRPAPGVAGYGTVGAVTGSGSSRQAVVTGLAPGNNTIVVSDGVNAIALTVQGMVQHTIRARVSGSEASITVEEGASQAVAFARSGIATTSAASPRVGASGQSIGSSRTTGSTAAGPGAHAHSAHSTRSSASAAVTASPGASAATSATTTTQGAPAAGATVIAGTSSWAASAAVVRPRASAVAGTSSLSGAWAAPQTFASGTTRTLRVRVDGAIPAYVTVTVSSGEQAQASASSSAATSSAASPAVGAGANAGAGSFSGASAVALVGAAAVASSSTTTSASAVVQLARAEAVAASEARTCSAAVPITGAGAWAYSSAAISAEADGSTGAAATAACSSQSGSWVSAARVVAPPAFIALHAKPLPFGLATRPAPFGLHPIPLPFGLRSRIP